MWRHRNRCDEHLDPLLFLLEITDVRHFQRNRIQDDQILPLL